MRPKKPLKDLHLLMPTTYIFQLLLPKSMFILFANNKCSVNYFYVLHHALIPLKDICCLLEKYVGGNE